MNQNRFCSGCGERLDENASFCAGCGTSVQPTSEESTDTSSSGQIEENVPQEPSKGASKKKKIIVGAAVIIGILVIVTLLFGEDEGAVDSEVAPQSSASVQKQAAPEQKQSTSAKESKQKTESVTPIVFSDEQASSFLLKPDDFPKNWTANRAGMFLDAKNDFLTDGNVKRIKITLETHETEAAAQAAFSAKKLEAQRTIDGRGISGDKLEDVKKYPLFVWNASQQANISGVEKWTVIGVYGNITVKVYHEGNLYAPKKNFAVDIAKKQIDRINGN